MPFEIVRNDLVKIKADAIVNTANPRPVIGSGTDTAVHHAAGPELLQARLAIGELAPGQAAVTPGFSLPARYVIHTVGPIWQGGDHGEAEILRACYRSCLELALEKGCRSIAFPLISTGNYGFPKPLALRIAVESFSKFLMEHDMKITLAVFSPDAFRLSEQLMGSVTAYIGANYVAEAEQREYALERPIPSRQQMEDFCVGAAMPAPSDLEELLKHRDAGFAETLAALIQRSGKKNSEIYKKANVDKKLFSKIMNNINYHPSKPTAVAFAVALELSLAETKDLVERAGYSMTHSSKFDIIIEYFLLQHNYNIFEINEVLFCFDQSLLGS